MIKNYFALGLLTIFSSQLLTAQTNYNNTHNGNGDIVNGTKVEFTNSPIFIIAGNNNGNTTIVNGNNNAGNGNVNTSNVGNGGNPVNNNYNGSAAKTSSNDCNRTTGDFCFANAGSNKLKIRVANGGAETMLAPGERSCLLGLQPGVYTIEAFTGTPYMGTTMFVDYYGSYSVMVEQCVAGEKIIR